MKEVFSIAGISRQAYHKASVQSERDSVLWQRLLELLIEYREDHPRSSARKIHRALKITAVGVNRFEKYVSAHGYSVKRVRSFLKTTVTGPNRYPNLVNGLEINGINQLWVSDITYFLTPNGALYIVLIMDVYSRKIIGYNASDNMMALNNHNALQMAFKNRNQDWFVNLIHHSDKGSQYGANLYTRILLKANIRISMANICYENPYAERINGIIKNDYLIAYKIDNLVDLKKSLPRSVKLYNNYPHGKLNQKSPNEFEQYLSQINPSDYPVMKLYDFKNEKHVNQM